MTARDGTRLHEDALNRLKVPGAGQTSLLIYCGDPGVCRYPALKLTKLLTFRQRIRNGSREAGARIGRKKA